MSQNSENHATNERAGSNTIPTIAIIISLVCAIFTGLTYYSSEASKRAELNILITKATFSVGEIKLGENATPPVPYTVEMNVRVSGVIHNEGPRMCQMKDLGFWIVFPLSDTLSKSWGIDGDLVERVRYYISEYYNDFHWTNKTFNRGETKKFEFIWTEWLDSYYWDFQDSEISDCRIKTTYDDGKGIQITEKRVAF